MNTSSSLQLSDKHDIETKVSVCSSLVSVGNTSGSKRLVMTASWADFTPCQQTESVRAIKRARAAEPTHPTTATVSERCENTEDREYFTRRVQLIAAAAPTPQKTVSRAPHQ